MVGSRERRLRLSRGWLSVGPLAFILLAVLVLPSLQGTYFAFTDWTGIGPAHFTGLDNIGRMASDSVVLTALVNTVLWTALSLVGQVALALMGAWLISEISRGRTFFRLAYFVPVIVPTIVCAQVFRGLYDPSFGVLEQLQQAGLFPVGVVPLANPVTIIPAVAFVGVWHGFGLLTVIYLAAIQAIDPQLHEAARLDGATAFQRFKSITLPGITPTIALSLVLVILGSILVFDYIWLMTRGGPGHSSEVLATASYKAFQNFDGGYSVALGLLATLLCGVVGAVFALWRRRGAEI